MFKVLQYSLGYTFRKTSTIILAAFLFLLSFGLPLSLYMGGFADVTSYDYVKAEVFFRGGFAIILIPVFLMFISYLTVVTGQVFKRGEEDGTTLMLVSSRYTRTQVILGRFGAMLIHISLVAFIFALGMSLASGFYHPSKVSFEIISFISLIFGAFFIGLFFTSLALIFSILMGRIGAIVTSIFIYVFMAILSPILIATSSTSTGISNLYRFNYKGHGQHEVFLYEDNNKNVKSQDVLRQSIPNQGILHQTTQLERLTQAKYSTFAWLDPWTQISQMLVGFNKSSSNPTPLDKISAVNIQDTDFFKGLKYIDGVTPITETISAPNAKFTFELGHVFEDIIKGTNVFNSVGGLSHSQLVQIDEDLDYTVGAIESTEFKDMVAKYETIISRISEYEINDNSFVASSQIDLPISSLVGLVKTIDEDNLVIDASTKLDFVRKTSIGAKNYSSDSISFEINGQPNSNISSYVQSGADEVFGGDMKSIIKRIAIYYAIYNTNKSHIADQVIKQNQPNHNSGKPVPIKDAIFDEFKNNFTAIDTYSTKTDQDIAAQFGWTYSASPIVPLPFIYIFWPALSLGLFGLAYWIHRKTDFK